MTDRRCFIVRCSSSDYATLVRHAAALGYASATSRVTRPGVARYLVDRGLGGGIILSDADRTTLGRVLWEVRAARAELVRIADTAFDPLTVARADVTTATDRIHEALQRLGQVFDSEVSR